MFLSPARDPHHAGLALLHHSRAPPSSDFDRMAAQGWKALEAEGKLPTTAAQEATWALDMGLPGAESITDRDIRPLRAAGFALCGLSAPS